MSGNGREGKEGGCTMGHSVEPIVPTVHTKEGHKPSHRRVPGKFPHTEIGMEPHVETGQESHDCHMTI